MIERLWVMKQPGVDFGLQRAMAEIADGTAR
jgi:hypothetical protein